MRHRTKFREDRSNRSGDMAYFRFFKMAAAAIFKIENRPYLRNGLTDPRGIWFGDAYWASEWDRKLKFPAFENSRWRTAAILKNRKSAISPERFNVSSQNLAHDAQCASEPDRKLKFSTFANPRRRTAVILKIENRP